MTLDDGGMVAGRTGRDDSLLGFSARLSADGCRSAQRDRARPRHGMGQNLATALLRSSILTPTTLRGPAANGTNARRAKF